MAIIAYIFGTLILIGFVGLSVVTMGDNYGFIKNEPPAWLEIILGVIFFIGFAGLLISGWVYIGMEVCK